MARLTRQVSIRSAQVRLPEHQSIGPALIKTAQTVGDMAFNKAADQRTQEAQIAASALNFERDGEGNLMAPSLPIGENGLIAPNIYAREYTNMVTARYIQQLDIDTAERLNLIATKYRFDPTGYRENAEAYVNKVTELAPDLIKSDVNMTAQTRMVEQYNFIIREKAERDHKEAAGVHMQSMSMSLESMQGRIRAGAGPDIRAGEYQKVAAHIVQGVGLNFYGEDQAAAYLEQLELNFALSNMLEDLSDVGKGELDPGLSYARQRERLLDIAKGEGTVEVYDETTGGLKRVSANDVFNQDELDLLSNTGLEFINKSEAVFDNVMDERLQASIRAFDVPYATHKIEQIMKGQVSDLDMLLEAREKADRDVREQGFDTTLRDFIDGEIKWVISSLGKDSLSSAQREPYEKYDEFFGRFKDELYKRVMDQGPQNNHIKWLPKEQQAAANLAAMDPVERNRLIAATRATVGDAALAQTEVTAKAADDLYIAATGTAFNFEEMILNGRQGSPEQWARLELAASDGSFESIGIWSQKLIDAILGKWESPQNMSPEILKNSLELIKLFRKNERFRANMLDANALGDMGKPIDYILGLSTEPTVDQVVTIIDQFNDENYSPYATWRELTDERQATYEQKVRDAIYRKYTATFKATGLKAEVWQGTPLAKNLSEQLPWGLEQALTHAMKLEAHFINPTDDGAFDAYLQRVSDRVLNENGYAPSTVSWSPDRFNIDRNALVPVEKKSKIVGIPGGWGIDVLWSKFSLTTRPGAEIVRQPPEYYLRDIDGNVDRDAVEYFKKEVQAKLDELYPDGTFRVGVNAGVVFAPEVSDDEGQPFYKVKLQRSDIREPNDLTETKHNRTDIVYLPLGDAMRQAEKARAKTRRRRNEMKAAQRLTFQKQKTQVSGYNAPSPL